MEDNSSYLNAPAIEIAEHIGRDHMEMCRFTGLDDIEYKKVEAAIQTMTSKVSRLHDRRGHRDKPAAIEKRLNKRRQRLWNSLRFDQIDDRRTDIKRTHVETCEWFLRSRCYLDWIDVDKLDQHAGLFWIKGKPGAGKSALMKFAVAQVEKVMDEQVVLSFFFHARGIELQKSTIGMYRSLLWQLLAKLPYLRSCFDSAGLVKYDIKDDTKDNTKDDTKTAIKDHVEHSDWKPPQWSLELLKDLLERVVLQTSPGHTNPRSLVCFIDALDECQESQIRDMVAFFELLCERAVASNIRFYVCFSSRHYPNVKMNRGLDLVLERQLGHSQDITNYINNKLRIGHSKLAEQIRQELQKKASGVFMWVVLVVEILNKEYDSGRIHALRKRLVAIPGDLHELFRDILTRDEFHRNELRLCIQWVLFARRPLSPYELYYAILSGLGPDVVKDLADEDVEITAEDVKRFILDCSKGLVEVVSSETIVVQFIHESVRDFLLRGNGLADLWTELGYEFRGYSHDILKECCVTYMVVADTSDTYLTGPLISESSVHFRHPPRLLSAASPQSYPQQDSSQLIFPDRIVPQQNHAPTQLPCPLIVARPWGIPTQLPPLPSFISTRARQLAARRFPFLEYAVQNVLHHADLAEKEGVSQVDFIGSFDWPRWLKFSNIFTEYEFSRHTPKASPIYILAENDLSNLIEIYPSRLSYFEPEYDRYGSPLYASILTKSYRALLKFLELEVQRQPNVPLLRGLLNQIFLSDREHRQSNWQYRFARGPKALDPLYQCCEGTLVPFLLAAGKDMGLLCEDWHSSIVAAVFKLTETFALQLLAAGFDLQTGDAGGLILLKASTEGWVAVAKEVLTHGNVDINVCDSLGLTPLQSASWEGHVEIVKLLLCTGRVNINSRDTKRRTPFSQAILRGNREIARLLINTGEVDVDIQIPLPRHTATPLAIASQKGYIEIAMLLLSTGKATVNWKDKFGRSSLSYAAERGRHQIVALLLQSQDIDADSTDKKHRTPLSYAAEKGQHKVISLLIKSPKVNLNSCDRAGWSPLLYAAYRGHQSTVKLLLQQDEVMMNSRAHNGLTALILAARAGHVGIVKLLLGKDLVDVDATTTWGDSALAMAKRMNHEGVAETLLASGKIKE